MKSGCAFLCADVFGRSCIVDVFAGGVFHNFLAAASTISVTLSCGHCFSWRKSFSGIRGCMLIGVMGDDCIATSCPVCGLGCSNVGDRENTGGDLVTSLLAGADEFIGVILFVEVDTVGRPTAGIGVKILEGAGKKLRQSW